MKTKFFLFLSVGTISAFAMQEDISKTIILTKKCIADIANINNDQKTLSLFFQFFFDNVANAQFQRWPSALLATAEEYPAINYLNCKYKPATEYLKEIIHPSYKQLDADFLAKYSETKDMIATWQWFAGHFKQEGIDKNINALKNRLIADVQNRNA